MRNFSAQIELPAPASVRGLRLPALLPVLRLLP